MFHMRFLFGFLLKMQENAVKISMFMENCGAYGEGILKKNSLLKPSFLASIRNVKEKLKNFASGVDRKCNIC